MRAAAVVYVITNCINGHAYVGVTRFTAEKRWAQHVDSARRNPRTHFHHAINKYGPDNFNVLVFASCLRTEWASQFERTVIKQFAPIYNQTNGGEITKGKRVAPEVAARIRACNTGKKRTPQQLKNMSASRLRLFSECPQLRQKAADAMREAWKCVDQEKRLAAVRAAWAKKKWTDEERAQISARQKGKRFGWSSPENVAKKAAQQIKPVECITLKTVFDSVLDAADATGIHFSNISRVCRGLRRQTGGLEFCFVEGEYHQ